MNDYNAQKWFDLYKTALLELERAAITGRVADARAEITIRLVGTTPRPAPRRTSGHSRCPKLPPCIGARGRAPRRRGQEAHSATDSAKAEDYRTQVWAIRAAVNFCFGSTFEGTQRVTGWVSHLVIG
jgi:hypothetical protein